MTTPALEIGSDPIETFERWLAAAKAFDPEKYDVTFLATTTRDGFPSLRAVLLRGVDHRGLVFYTNHRSRKGEELLLNPRAALALYWPKLERQVRVEGDVERTTAEESQAYFDTRPWESRIGAWASQQSKEISGRDELIAKFEEYAAKYPDTGRPGSVPVPPHWGGVRVVPRVIELWVAGDHRLHDRHVFRRSGDGWAKVRLSP
ncbi:pyridoxamine 5'-phosphate oxidase [Myxococcota bacterium]|nr:pyridoxamine 5'-phosphate oxidase [Myxococcota bacterium]